MKIGEEIIPIGHALIAAIAYLLGYWQGYKAGKALDKKGSKDAI